MDTAALTVIANTEAATDLLGQLIAEVCVPGLVIGLSGDLGAGKTRLVRAVAVALGADPQAVNSPTFVLMQPYAARIPVYHFDTYRLKHASEFGDLGAEELFDGPGVCLIEWAERVADYLPEDHLAVTATVLSPESRQFELRAGGGRSADVLARLQRLMAAAPELRSGEQ